MRHTSNIPAKSVEAVTALLADATSLACSATIWL
jgi:hypothetical protein